MPHQTLTSTADLDAAIATKGKYVLIYGYEGTPSAKADEMADKFTNTDAYAVDLAAHSDIKEKLGASAVPALVVYKDGQLVKSQFGADEKGRQEILDLLS